MRLLPSSRRARLLLALIVALGFFLDFVFYTGFYASDDRAYLLGAHQLANGLPFLPGLASSRLAVTVPDAAVHLISGGEIAWIAWFHVLYHLGLTLVAFSLGRLLEGERTGLLAAGLVAVNPLYYVFAGAVLPDNALAFWLGVLMIVLELARRRGSPSPLAARRALRWYFAAGLLLGLGYSCKETGLIMTIPAAVWVIESAPRLRSTIWIRNGAFMAAGLAAFFLIEQLALRGLSGDWIWRLGHVAGTSDVLLQRMEVQGVTPIERFSYAGSIILPYLPITMWFLLAASLIYPFLRGRHLGICAFFWWPLLYITVGTTNFTAYLPSSMQTRYYSIVVLPATLMAASLVLRLYRVWGRSERIPLWTRSRVRAPLLLLILAFVSWKEAEVNAPRSGNIYYAPFPRGLTRALEMTRDHYPQYPVVLEPYYRQRMRPLFYDGETGGVLPEADMERYPPHPPFLYLERVGVARKHRRIDGSIVEWRSEGRDTLAMRTLHTSYPPRTRLDALASALRRAFGLEPRPPVVRNTRRGGVAIQLVTRRMSARRNLHPDADLYSLADNARVEKIEGAYYVHWVEDEKDSDPSFYVQLFDRDSYRWAPTPEAARVAPGHRRLIADVPLRLVGDAKAEILVHLYGYDADGGMVHETATAELESQPNPTVLTVEVRSTEPLHSFKLRTKVVPLANEPGGLQLFPVRIR